MRNFRLSFMLFVVFLSCTDEETKVNLAPIAKFQYSVDLDRILLNGSFSTDPENSTLTYEWTSSSPEIIFFDAADEETFFRIPAITLGEVNVTLTVNDGKATNSYTERIMIPSLTDVRAFGLGENLTVEFSNDVSYEWYVDQYNTGTHAMVNCGPTSVTMAAHWTNEGFGKTPVDARNAYRSEGGWWFTNDIINYLDDNNVNNWTISLTTMDEVTDEIDEGNIVILCLDMFLVKSAERDEYRVGKFYNTEGVGWGHFIVVKGYKVVDGKTFFEVYDPFSIGKKNSDNTYKGKNRYYTEADLDKATQEWWDYAIVVSKDESDGGRKAIDHRTIIHKAGR